MTASYQNSQLLLSLPLRVICRTRGELVKIVRQIWTRSWHQLTTSFGTVCAAGGNFALKKKKDRERKRKKKYTNHHRVPCCGAGREEKEGGNPSPQLCFEARLPSSGFSRKPRVQFDKATAMLNEQMTPCLSLMLGYKAVWVVQWRGGLSGAPLKGPLS